MPGQQFNYLPLLRTYKGRARLGGGGSTSPQTVANRNVQRQAHSATLDAAAQTFSTDWKARKAQRQATDPTLPEVPAGVSMLLEVDPSLDLDALRRYFDFEIVAEQEDGFVIVASEDIDMATFRDKVRGFAVEVRGSATIAEVHRLHTNDADRLARILSEHLLGIWGQISDEDSYIVDIGIACTGTLTIPKRPKRGKRTKDADWAEQEFTWSEQRAAAYGNAEQAVEFSVFPAHRLHPQKLTAAQRKSGEYLCSRPPPLRLASLADALMPAGACAPRTGWPVR